VPRFVEFRDSLPLTMIGKPDKKKLKEEERLKEEAAEKAPQNTAAIKSNPKDRPKI
jgi:acyl-CoA synthetase (AMP-forming)/AMP-acid ligase II